MPIGLQNFIRIVKNRVISWHYLFESISNSILSQINQLQPLTSQKYSVKDFRLKLDSNTQKLQKQLSFRTTPIPKKSFKNNYLVLSFQSILFNRPFIFNMALRAEDQLQTIQQLNAHSQSVPKACTVGVIIDATNAYFDQTKHKYVKKIKLVDDTYNTNKYSPFQKFPYLTVFFYSVKIEDLPNPRFIGDLLYLRRFSFGHYNQSFQGHYLQAKYCSWALINTDTNSPHTEQYQTSRSDIDLGEQKYANLSARIRELRKFTREYISTTSILSILPTGIVPKDTDLIVQVLKRTEDGFRLTNGREQIFLANIPSFASEGSIAKLRSVARLDQQGKTKVVVPNNFTSLINLSAWSHDSQTFLKHFSTMEVEEDQSIFTSLSQLNAMPLNECQNKKYFVKVEVAASSTTQFVQALKFYDEKKNALSDSQKGGALPVYKFNFVCIDQSLAKQNKFVEIFVFSYDGKGGDFVRRVNLHDLNEFSNYAQESLYFSQRIEELLNGETVRMTVEVLSDGKGNRMLRALSVM